MKLLAISAVLVIFSTLSNARFFQEEKPPGIKKLENFERNSVRGGFLADISGTCIDSLVASSPPCSMQDQCDIIIDMAYFIGGKKKAQLIKLAQELVQSEKNTPEKGLRSLDCNKLPRHPELNGLFPKQDPSNGPGRRKPPFVPKQYKPIRKFIFKSGGKVIAPGGRFQRPGRHTRGVTKTFNGKVVAAPKSDSNPSAINKIIAKINRKKLSKSEKTKLISCIKTLRSSKKSKQAKTNCETFIKSLARKFPKRN